MNDSKAKVSYDLKIINRNSKIKVTKWRKLRAGLKVSQKNSKIILKKSEALAKWEQSDVYLKREEK